MRFSHAHAVFDVGEQKQAEEPAEAEAEAEVDEKAEVDSIDSLIWTCGSSMLMRFSNAHEALPC
jgi:hypothetical protein